MLLGGRCLLECGRSDGLVVRSCVQAAAGRKRGEMPLNADRNRCVSPPTGIPSSRAHAALWAGGCSLSGCSDPCASAVHRWAGFVQGVMWVLPDRRAMTFASGPGPRPARRAPEKKVRPLLPPGGTYR